MTRFSVNILFAMSVRRTYLDLFSEGGPFVAAEEKAFRHWPGASGWKPMITDLEAPGGVREHAGGAMVFFDPEDPGPMQVGWTETSLVLLRWHVDSSPLVLRKVPETKRSDLVGEIDEMLDRTSDLEDLGVVELGDGLVVVAWAALAGADRPEFRPMLESIADSSPRETRGNAGDAPGLTVVRLRPGSYSVRGVFGAYDEERDRSATFVRLDLR